MEITDAGRDFVAQEGYDPVCGGRLLNRCLQHEPETRAWRALLPEFTLLGPVIVIDVNGQLAVSQNAEKSAGA